LKNKPKESAIPQERHETIRQKIMDILEGNSFSARDISGEVGISVKEVFEHLEHIQKSVDRGNYHLVITPAECKKCGFVFRKRERLKKPGKCPVCRGESIQEPLFCLRRTGTPRHDDGQER
jgi:predicted Zn-ribbon and HTH transcriptional regulator